MPQRRFLIASSLARLIRRTQGTAGRIVEGHFLAHAHRSHFVSIEPDRCFLVLGTAKDNDGAEVCTEVPRSQAEALFSVCAGKVGFECTSVRLQRGREAVLQHFIVPGPLDLLSVELPDGEASEGFVPPVWFGPDVTQNPAYHRESIARVGMPAPDAVLLSDEMLNELLDTLEEAELAAQLEYASVQRDSDPGPELAYNEAASSEPDQIPVPPIENTQKDDLPDIPAQAVETLYAPSPAVQRGPAAAVAVAERRDRERVFFGLPARRPR